MGVRAVLISGLLHLLFFSVYSMAFTYHNWLGWVGFVINILALSKED